MRLNKLETLISKLTTQTKDEEIHWKNIGSYFPLKIKHTDFIKRAFRCEDYKDDVNLYFAEFVMPNFIMSGGEDIDKDFFKLFIVRDGAILIEIDHDEVDPEILGMLYQAIDKHNTDLKDFLDDL